MGRVKNKIKHKSLRVGQYIFSFLKWVFIALVTGAIGGAIGGAFRFCVDLVTKVRTAHEFLIYFLPLAGVVIVFLYKISKLKDKADTNLVIRSIRSDTKVPLVLAPVIFISTVLTHLFGGSAGREGAALQMGGSIGYYAGKLLRLDDRDLLCTKSHLYISSFLSRRR